MSVPAPKKPPNSRQRKAKQNADKARQDVKRKASEAPPLEGGREARPKW